MLQTSLFTLVTVSIAIGSLSGSLKSLIIWSSVCLLKLPDSSASKSLNLNLSTISNRSKPLLLSARLPNVVLLRIS